MPDEKSEVAPTERKVVHLTEGDKPAPVYYVNNTEFSMTSWDMSFRFARIDRAEAETLYVQDQAVISMSLQHAKALMIILGSYIQQYERDHGKLAVPFPETAIPIESETAMVKVDSNA